ncbi:MAG: hypothetical protein ACRELB_25235, partial [Polyangiaceae bacterium]
SDPVTVREAGYMTTAGQAIARLAQIGITLDLATQAAKSLRPEAVASFARGANARAVASELGAQELFDGAIFRASAEVQCYEGAWLDLRALVQSLAIPAASSVLQALHLAATLSEVAAETPLHLSTAGTMRSRRPGERTYGRPSLAGAAEIPAALARLRPRTMPLDADPTRDRRLNPALLARVRERLTKDSSPALQMHLAALDRALSGLGKQSGPMAEDQVRAVERRLDEGDPKGVEDAIRKLERSRGAGPPTRYLRARLALLRGDQTPREIARRLSKIADEGSGFPQAALVAARTWLAVGQDDEAQRLAARLVDDPAATDSERLVAQEILASIPVVVLGAPTATEIVGPSTTRMPGSPQRAVGLGDLPLPRALPALTDRPPPIVEPSPSPAAKRAVGPRPPYRAEIVESLPLPPSCNESDLGVNDRPTTPLAARIAMIRLARDLARDYRLWYGKTLRCDVIGIDTMQQHLARRYVKASITDDAVAWELRRHGALLSEVLARKLGGEWVDVAPSEPGYWAMTLPPDVRTHPIGRVYRFVVQGHHERDLISYFLELDRRSRG